MKKIRWMIMAAVVLFLPIPMGSAEAGTKAGAGGYKLVCRELSGTVPCKMTLTAGKKCTIRLKKAGTGKTVKTAKIKWKTSDKAVVKVQKKTGGGAVLSAKKKGNATVTAVYKHKKYRCKVTVKKRKDTTKTADNGKTDDPGGNVPKAHKENGTQTGADKPVLNAKEVSLYYYIKSDADVVPADPSHKDSFRLKVSGTKKEVKKWELSGEDAFYFEITDYGLVTLKHAPAYEDGSVSIKAEATLSDGTVLSATVTGYSETNLYLDRLFQKFAKENITSGMAEKEKADRVAGYIGEISDYEFYNDSWEDIFLRGKGDCMASRHAITNEGFCIFLNAKNVTKNGFNFDSIECITKEKDELLHKGRLERGDMVMTTRGTIGNVAIYDGTIPFEHLRINSGMVIYRGGDELHKPYLIWLYKSRLILEQINKMQTGSAQPQLPIKVMNSLLIPIPSVDEQKEIVRILDKILAKEKRIYEIAEGMVKQIDLMKKSILAKAFRGDLGTNIPEEENSVELLKKVLEG